MPERAGALRRIGAMLYDALAVLAVLMLATVVVLPLNDGRAIEPGNALFSGYLLAVGFGYFGWSWTHGGQTLGMRAWRIRVVALDGNAVGWGQSLLRFVAALGGVGLVGMFVGREGIAWQDRLSHSKVVRSQTKPDAA